MLKRSVRHTDFVAQDSRGYVLIMMINMSKIPEIKLDTALGKSK